MTAIRNTGLSALAFSAALMGASAAAALSLAECTRVTHPSHGGEAGHRDFGEGLVAWGEWWSQEGIREVITLADCRTGAALSTVTRSHNMAEDIPFDRTDRAIDIVETLATSPVMRGFDQIAGALEDLRLSPERLTLTSETCACAASYPGLRGDRPAFEMERL